MGDIIIYVLSLSSIVLVFLLSNRKIKKSLKRAEEALVKERDMLEVKIEERTQQLKQEQVEKMMQLYRFAEMGRLTAGLFHDLATPLSMVSLNLALLRKKHEAEHIQHLLKRAISGTRYLEHFIQATRKKLQYQEVQKQFSLNTEIKKVVSMVTYNAKLMHTKVVFQQDGHIKVWGNPIKFNQLILNLLLNAIDAYDDIAVLNDDHRIIVTATSIQHTARITIQDWGCGIKQEYLKKIFDPFFTTKGIDKGTGIGLSITKHTIEKDFGGSIMVTSTKETGTIFTIHLPIQERKRL